ncbi:MAG: hypothetical protein JWO57_2123 [Pseudonocardiales bacterium]|nr:hypothetical protein [Pseudonocardiales bacterium]
MTTGIIAAPRRRRHRGLYWFAVLLAVAALVGGGVVAYASYAATAGPDGAVKGYLAALARSDAPAALGFGDLPAGPHNLLTSTVLREQQKIAPMRDVHIVSTDRNGPTATVTVRYRLAFASGTQQITDAVTVVSHKGSWRLARTALATQLQLLQASARATIVGAAVPVGPLLLFPGALPIRFDTPYLELDPATSGVRLSGPDQTELTVQVSAAGRTAVDSAVAAGVRSCLGGAPHADPRCPLPSDRSVPGSLRATVPANVAKSLVLSVARDARGVIQVTARLKLAGQYAELDFDNLPVIRKGAVTLSLQAKAFARTPILIDWQASP